MKTIKTDLEGLIVLEPDIYSDERGYFFEMYQKKRYEKSGVFPEFIQDNLSKSRKGVLRGLHYQVRHPQAKLVQVLDGRVFDVAVDVRRKSPTFGKWFGVTLSSENMRQIFIPAGFAHGFCVLSESALFFYKCSEYFAAADECGILWSDPQIGIDWPVRKPVISGKDLGYALLSEIPSEKLPVINGSRGHER